MCDWYYSWETNFTSWTRVVTNNTISPLLAFQLSKGVDERTYDVLFDVTSVELLRRFKDDKVDSGLFALIVLSTCIHYALGIFRIGYHPFSSVGTFFYLLNTCDSRTSISFLWCFQSASANKSSHGKQGVASATLSKISWPPNLNSPHTLRHFFGFGCTLSTVSGITIP